MPQVWLSYDEIGQWLRCDTGETAAHVLRKGWSRRRCSDGLTRVKLPPTLTGAFLRYHLRAEAADGQADAQVEALRGIVETGEALRPGLVGR